MKILSLLLLLPSLAFACPVITGHFECLETTPNGGKILIDFYLKSSGIIYTFTMPTNEEIKWVADGMTKVAIKHTGEGDIIHTSTLTCENEKLHLADLKEMYHDMLAENVKPGDVPALQTYLSEFLYLNAQGNLVQEDHTMSAKMGQAGNQKDETITCNKIKDTTNEN
jgi:predicted methyltransferase